MELTPIDIEVSKASVNGKTYDVLDYEEYAKNFNSYKDREDVAVKYEADGKNIILPYNGKMKVDPITPGIYNAGCVDFVKIPDRSQIDNYVPDRIITFSNKSDIRDIIADGKSMQHLDEPFIMSSNNTTIVAITDKDQPEMRCLKAAVNQKKIDIDRYAGRFGSNYPNDKRQLKGSTATLNIIKRFCDNCDMEAILTIRDKSPDVLNPMGKEISISLTDFDPDDLINVTALNNESSDDESED